MVLKSLAVSGFILTALAATPVQARDGFGCAVDKTGVAHCAPPGGGAVVNLIGGVTCGPGQCVADKNGLVHCSTSPNGGAVRDSLGNVVCTDGCIPGSADYCQKPEE